MRTSALKYTILSTVSKISMLILALMPFHALLTVWLASSTGHYTLIRLWKEILLLFVSVAALGLIALDHKIRSHTLTRRLVWLILLYLLAIAFSGLLGLARGDVSHKALGYGLIVDLRFLTLFLVVWATALRTSRLRANWKHLVVWPALIVVICGLLQAFLLPNDFLRHFGYGPSTIPVMETINHNSHYIRVASTLRGANPLGAYMIIPISVLGVLLARAPTRRNWQYGLLAGAYAVLFLSFSRSALLGAVLATIIVLATNIHAWVYRRQVVYGAAVVLVLLTGLLIGFRHNSRVENVLFHTETKSTIKMSSNQGHRKALTEGLHDIVHEPLGRGVGSAGPASAYNKKAPARISENYFIQIGQEAGWIGLALFSVITAGIGYLLWLRRADSLALSLFAALVGLVFVNMLSHAWADDTLAYVFWGLAGIAMVPDGIGDGTKHHAK